MLLSSTLHIRYKATLRIPPRTPVTFTLDSLPLVALTEFEHRPKDETATLLDERPRAESRTLLWFDFPPAQRYSFAKTN